MQDEEDPTGWLIVDGGKKQCRQCLYGGRTVILFFFKTPNLRLLSAYTLLGERKFFLGENTDCIFSVGLRGAMAGWTG